MPITDWQQYNIEFPDRTTASRVTAQHIYPALTAVQDTNALHTWWFLRKRPWRLRYLTEVRNPTAIPELLDELTHSGRISSWAYGIYEPEITAFGGDTGMEIAHRLFHHDSHHVLAQAAQRTILPMGQREATVLLCSSMLRAAGLDWYEQGDVWRKVADLRPTGCAPLTSDRAPALKTSMHRLMTAEPHGLRLTSFSTWITAFEDAGRALADLARRGELTRGLRAVLAHHILFHANRAALPLADQATLADLAWDVVFNSDAQQSPSATNPTTKVNTVTTLSDEHLAASADQLRSKLTDRLKDQQALRRPAIEAAFRNTPRHLFLPGVPLDQAYADDPVYTKADETGVNISAASQPWMVATMLEQLDAQPGDRIMEAGAGTGYNAAIMAAIVGETGHITTIDVDEDLVAGAREHLDAAGIGNVDVMLGDGALGHPTHAPFDRIIATVGAYEIPTAWLDQLAPGGRLVVPLRLRGTNSRNIIFERDKTGWRSRDSQLAVFMPLRGIGDDARRYLHLTSEKDVTLQVHQDQTADAKALAGVLSTERHETWTGVLFPPMVPFEWLDLWLCLRLDNALMRMNVEPDAKTRLSLTPMFGWGAMATVREKDLAYLTIRPAPPADDGAKLYEVGVIGHGTNGRELAQQVAQEICTWDASHRSKAVRFEIPDTPEASDPAAGRYVLERPHHPITVIWD